MQTLWQDLRYGARMLFKKPGFTFIAVLTLALGIGATTAIFSVVNAVLLKPLPYPAQERLTMMYLNNPETPTGRGGYGYADFLALQERNQNFAKVAAISPGNHYSLTGSGAPEQIIGAAVSAEFFDVLGVGAARGRTFLAEEGKPGAAPTVIVSHRFWEQYLGSNANIVGQTITLNGESRTIIGVMPQDFRFTFFGPAELWTTLQLAPPRARPAFYLRVIGRLKPEANVQQAQAELNTLAAQVQQQFPASGVKVPRLLTLKEGVVGEAKLSLSILLGAVFFVLLIAIVNVANLLLARAGEREKEMVVRAALGASRLRLVRQTLVESVLLALIGGAFGWALANWGIDLIVALSPKDLPRFDEISLDQRILGFTFLLTLLSGLLFGLVPALQHSHVDLNTALKEGGRSGIEGFGRRWSRKLFIVAEFALALMLLTGAGLMIRSFLRLQRVDPGFEPERVLTAQIALPRSRYGEAGRVGSFQQQLLQRVASLPGVESASASMSLPPDLLMMRNPYTVEGWTPVPGVTQPTADQLLISPDYFRTLGIKQIAGRSFDDNDDATAPPVIINRTLARQHFPNQDPVGKRMQTGDYNPAGRWMTIVGVVEDVNYSGLHETPGPALYTPFLQNLWWRSLFLSVRTTGDQMSIVNPLREAVWSIDRDLPVTQIKTMNQVVSAAIAEPRVYTVLLGIFGAVALLLAAVGIYGVMAYSVTQRRREIGVRMALGAPRDAVLRMVIGAGMRLALAGTAIGLVGAFALTRLMEKLLFGVSATDPLTFAMIAAVLILTAFLACWIPARQATRIDPLEALRCE